MRGFNFTDLRQEMSVIKHNVESIVVTVDADVSTLAHNCLCILLVGAYTERNTNL